MSSHHFSTHLDGTETVRVSGSGNHDALYVDQGTSNVELVLPHFSPTRDRVRFLRELAEAARELADEIDLRDLSGVA